MKEEDIIIDKSYFFMGDDGEGEGSSSSEGSDEDNNQDDGNISNQDEKEFQDFVIEDIENLEDSYEDLLEELDAISEKLVELKEEDSSFIETEQKNRNWW